MKRYVIFLLILVGSAAHAQTYTTLFPATENPISEGGNWVGGQSAGGNLWGNVQTTQTNGPMAIGVSEPTGFGDPTAILTGTWAANQTVTAKVRVLATFTGCCHEVELRLRNTISASSIKGYEVYCSTVPSPGGYCHIARWNGPNGAFCNIEAVNPGITLVNGDIFSATIAGTNPVIITGFRNGTQIVTATDTGQNCSPGGAAGPWASGNPGIGFFIGGANDWSNFGFSSFTATSGTTRVAATCNTADVQTSVTASLDGDIVNVPAGTCTWTAGLAPITQGISIIGAGSNGQYPVGSGITTIIDNAVSPNKAPLFYFQPTFGKSLSRVCCMVLTPLSTITASSALSSPVAAQGTCTASGCPNIRFDHLVFPSGNLPSGGPFFDWRGTSTNPMLDSNQGNTLFTVDNVLGVIDHNSAYATAPGFYEFVNYNLSSYLGVGQWGDNSNALGPTYGTSQALYIESNFLEQTGSAALFPVAETEGAPNGQNSGKAGGGRVVCRFNTFPGLRGGTCVNHGTESDGRVRTGVFIEYYGNVQSCPNSTFQSCTANGFLQMAAPRGGSLIQVENSYTGKGGNIYAGLAGNRANFNLGGWGACDGTGQWDQNDGVTYFSGTIASSTGGNPATITVNAGGTGTVPPWTANQWFSATSPWSVHDSTLVTPQGAEIASNGSNTLTLKGSFQVINWGVGDSIQILKATQCLDFAGKVGGSLLSGSPATPTNATPGYVFQSESPSYEAADRSDFNLSFGTMTTNTLHIVPNKDYFAQLTVLQTAQTSPTTPFNGSAGTGFGTLANRPPCTSGCVVGVGYWATDQGNWNQSSPLITFPDGTSQGTLYRWNGTAWDVKFTPFTFPHPLISGSAPPPPAPGVSFSPTSINFGSLNTGVTSAPQTLTITNTGTVNLTWTAYSTSNPANTTFTASGGTCPVTNASGLAPSLSCTVSITGMTTAVGTQNGTFNFPSNAPASPQTVPLSITGVNPVNPAVSIAPSSGAFGTSTTPIPFTITSTGTSNLIMGSPPATVTDADFLLQVIAGQCTSAQSIAPGATCKEQVGFAPLSAGAKSGSLNIFDNVTGSPQVIPLTGTGIVTSSFAPSSLLFGNVIVNQTANQNVTLQSTGNVPLLISSIVATGANYSQTNNCPASLAAGNSCVVQVTFAPAATGTSAGTLTITDNSPTSPHVITASGSGILVPTTSTGVTIQGAVQQ